MESQMSNEQIDTELYDLFVLFVFFALSLRVWFDALLSMCFTLNNIYVDFNSNQCHAI